MNYYKKCAYRMLLQMLLHISLMIAIGFLVWLLPALRMKRSKNVCCSVLLCCVNKWIEVFNILNMQVTFLKRTSKHNITHTPQKLF